MKYRVISLLTSLSMALSLFLTPTAIKQHPPIIPGVPYAIAEGNYVEQLEIGDLLVYRGTGEIQITIKVDNEGNSVQQITSAHGACSYCGVESPQIDFAIEGGTATGEINLDSIPFWDADWVEALYQLTGTQQVDVFDEEENFIYSYSTAFSIDLYLLSNQVIRILKLSGDNVIAITVSKGGWQDGFFVGLPVPGVEVSPSSGKFQIEPATNTTNQGGSAVFFIVLTNAGLSSMPDSPLAPARSPDGDIEGTIDVATPDGPTAQRTYSMPFAKISCLRGNVSKVDSFGVVSAAQMDDKLLPGNFIRLGSPTTDEQGNDITPLVCIDFYNGDRNIAESSFAKEGSYINIKIEEAGVGGIFEQSWQIDLMNLKQDLSDQHREYMRLVVYKLFAWRITAPLEWGWIGTKAAGKAVETGFKWAAEKLGYGPQGYIPLNPWPFTGRAVGSAGIPALQSPTWPDEPNDTGFTVPSISARIMGDGSVQIDNWYAPVEVTVKDQESGLQQAATLLGTGTSSSIDREYTAFSATTPIQTQAATGTMTLNPVDGSHLVAPPLIQVAYPWNVWDPVLQESLVVRLNGVLITPYLVPLNSTDGGCEWQIPASWPLSDGDNELTGWIMTRGGSVYTATSHFSMESTPHTPQFLKAYRGQTQTILRWQAVRDADLTGYLVYRASTSTGTPTLITSTPLTQSVYITDQAGWYSVAGTDQGGHISALSEPVLGDLDPTAAASVPATPADFQVEVGEGAVDITFTPDSLIPAYRLERAVAQGGPYSTLALLSGDSYQDRAVSIGGLYWYRLLALGLDGSTSAPTTPLSATITNLAPVAPNGFGATWNGDFIQLDWDSSRESDLAGYNLYRSTLYGSFVKLNTTPLTDTTFSDEVDADSIYLWKLAAVDNQGLESQASSPVEISTWVHPLDAFRQPVFLPMVAK